MRHCRSDNQVLPCNAPSFNSRAFPAGFASSLSLRSKHDLEKVTWKLSDPYPGFSWFDSCPYKTIKITISRQFVSRKSPSWNLSIDITHCDANAWFRKAVSRSIKRTRKKYKWTACFNTANTGDAVRARLRASGFRSRVRRSARRWMGLWDKSDVIRYAVRSCFYPFMRVRTFY